MGDKMAFALVSFRTLRAHVPFILSVTAVLAGVALVALMKIRPPHLLCAYTWAVAYPPFAWFLICSLVCVGTLGLWHSISPNGFHDCRKWLFGLDIPESSRETELEGPSTFIALASFALAEG